MPLKLSKLHKLQLNKNHHWKSHVLKICYCKAHLIFLKFLLAMRVACQSQWPRSLRRGLQPSPCWDRGFESHQGHGCLLPVSVCLLSGRGLCNRHITHPEESYRVWCVWVWSRTRPDLGCCTTGKESRLLYILFPVACTKIKPHIIHAISMLLIHDKTGVDILGP
jgi:hypothetical protein